MSFLRETLTILAVILVLALSAALAAPLFIDWGAHRGWVEQRLSAALGGEVRVSGDIDVRLLPAPRLELAGASWRSAPAGQAALDVQRMRLEIAVAPLMQGVVRFVEAHLERPRLTAAVGADGAVLLPQLGEHGGGVAFERLEIRQGEILLTRSGGAPLAVSGLDVDADASSLLGPFRGSGSFASGEGRVGFRFGAGVVEDDRLRIKFATDAGAGAMQFDLDGNLIAQDAGAGRRLRFEGGAGLAGVLTADGVDIPWRASGTLAADASQARLEPMDLRFGAPERQTTATGALSADLSARAVSVRVSAPQLDVDRMLDAKEDTGAVMARVSGMIAKALDRAPGPRAVSLRLDASAPAVTLGGDTITDASVALELPRQGDDRLALSGNLPGRAFLSLDGGVESGAAARFSGKLQASARDLPRLAQWIERADADLAERLRGAPFRIIEIGGDFELSRHAIAGRNLSIRADRSTLTGAAAFTSAIGGEPARLFVDFRSPALDIDGLPNLRGPARALQDADLNLAIDARAIRVAGVGGGVVDAGRIRGKLTRNGGRLELERLSVENVGGATLSASGHVDESGAKLDGRLEAQRLVDLAALVRRVAPGPLADLFNDRAVALSPARIDVSADALMSAGAIDLRHLRIEGSARGTRIAAAMRPDGEQVEAEADLSSADTPMLLRQLGFETLPIRGAPRSRLTVRARGALAKGYEVEGAGEVSGAGVSFRGRVGDRGGRFGADGQGRIFAKDSSQLLQVLALAWPDAQASIPLDLSATLGVNADAVEATALTGSLAGARVAGGLRFAAEGDALRRTLSGALNVDRMSSEALTVLALGPSSERAGSGWSQRAFAPGLADPPPTRIDLRVGAMDVRGLDARNVSARLVASQGAVAIENMTARIGETAVAGRIALRRDKADASFAATLDLTSKLNLQGQLSAGMNARLELAATGGSERALVNTLAGSGRARLTGIVIPAADPQAVDRVVALAEKDAIPPDERAIVVTLQKELARAPLRTGAAQFDVLAASGVIRLQPVKLETPGADATLSASFDVRSLAVEQTLDIVSHVVPPKWTDPNPRVRLVWSGPPDRAVRSIDAAALVNGLSARAILRESARIDALEADIRERAMFNRRLRLDEWRRRREAEVRAFEAEQARQEQLRLEAERRAADKQRLLEELNKLQALPPLQLPGASPN